MKSWIEDILDQLATAHVLAHASLTCGERLALIVVDNAVEYTCKAYVQVHKRLIPKVIVKKDWDQKKQRFHDMLDFIVQQEPTLQPYANTIKGFHDIRNDLYHGGHPYSVASKTVDDYSKVARTTVGILLGVNEDDSKREGRIAQIHASLLGEAGKEVKPGVVFETVNVNAIRFTTVGNVTAADAICLVLHGFPQQLGDAPNRDQLKESLTRSGHSLHDSVLNARLFDLKKNQLIRKGELALTAAGRKRLQKKYLS